MAITEPHVHLRFLMHFPSSARNGISSPCTDAENMFLVKRSGCLLVWADKHDFCQSFVRSDRDFCAFFWTQLFLRNESPMREV